MAAVLTSPPSEPFHARYERHVWHSRFGDIVTEVIGDDVYVDGKRVEQQEKEASSPAPAGGSTAEVTATI